MFFELVTDNDVTNINRISLNEHVPKCEKSNKWCFLKFLIQMTKSQEKIKIDEIQEYLFWGIFDVQSDWRPIWGRSEVRGSQKVLIMVLLMWTFEFFQNPDQTTVRYGPEIWTRTGPIKSRPRTGPKNDLKNLDQIGQKEFRPKNPYHEIRTEKSGPKIRIAGPARPIRIGSSSN